MKCGARLCTLGAIKGNSTAIVEIFLKLPLLDIVIFDEARIAVYRRQVHVFGAIIRPRPVKFVVLIDIRKRFPERMTKVTKL